MEYPQQYAAKSAEYTALGRFVQPLLFFRRFSSAAVDACVIYLSVLALPVTYQFTSLIEKDWTSVQLMS